MCNPTVVNAAPVMTSRDIVAGLGAAPRELLAACLALFDDSTLQHRIGTLVHRWTSGKNEGRSGTTDAEAVAAVRSSLHKWKASTLSDDEMRVLLWIYLREAFALSPATFASSRSAATAAEDIVARALHVLQPGRLEKLAQELELKETKDVPATLDALARKTMEELMTSFFSAQDTPSVEARERLLAETRARLAQLPPEDRERLMQAAGADGLNDAALRKILLTGGSLGAFGASVSLAGFSAYILAAQASAFLPLVSGPALVSVVAVLANPITIIAATAGMGWWATRSANEKVRGAVGVRVISLLALNGLEAGGAGIRAMLKAFPSLEGAQQTGSLKPDVLARYLADWRTIASASWNADSIDREIVNIMERPAGEQSAHARLSAFVSEHRDTVVLAGLTLGDIAYNAFSLDPTVLGAADFSRVAELDNPVAFSAFAHRIESMDTAGHLGAVSNVKGYVAERVVAAQLIDQGHVVEFPEASNQAGWDISVDGIKFQVKDVGDLSGLQRHFAGSYDYPVIANAELADELAKRSADNLPEWADRVHFVEGYSNEVVEHVTRSSLQAGDNMLHPNVPIFVLVLSGIRNIERMNRDEITGTQAFQEILLDGGTRAGLAVAGNYVGVGVGLLVFGPAGALVFGALMPILSQRQSGRLKQKLDDWVQDKTYRAWAIEAKRALDVMTVRLDSTIHTKMMLLQTRQPADSQAVVSCYLRWRVEDELGFLREALLRLKAIRAEEGVAVELLASRVLSWVSTSTLHPSVYQVELTAVSDIFRRRPSAAERIGVVTDDGVKRAKEAAVKVTGSMRNLLAKLSDNSKRKH